jgi:hypothetical protein
MEMPTRYCMGIATIQTAGPGSTSWQWIAYTETLAEWKSTLNNRPLRNKFANIFNINMMRIGSFFTENAVERRSLFSAWECVSVLESQLWALGDPQRQRLGWHCQGNRRGFLSSSWKDNCTATWWFYKCSSSRATWTMAKLVVLEQRSYRTQRGRFPAVVEHYLLHSGLRILRGLVCQRM